MKGDFLFLDIDGCLSRGKYAPFDVAALQALAALAQNAETEEVLCTGRSLSYVEAIAQFVRFGRYAVTDQGALLYDYLEDEVVFAVQLVQDAGDAGRVAGEGDVAEVIDGVFWRDGRVPLGNQRRVHFFDGGVGAELRAEFHDVFVREVQV